jgi:hypothetical protein
LSDIYNLRVGDMVYNVQQGHNVVAVVYKTTPKYIYYAICAGKGREPPGEERHFVTTGHKTSKNRVYRMLDEGDLSVSYACGTKKRRKVTAIPT